MHWEHYFGRAVNKYNRISLNVYTHIKFDNAQKEVELVQQRQQKEMENVRKELEQVGAIRPKIIPFKNEA